ncbi:MAG: cobalt-precorrin 5A hydrolase, partial [Methanomicrobiales archaeon]|nr:cobalt-precorrin 5A hydrolase [Methanomicrobiales archaeon]
MTRAVIYLPRFLGEARQIADCISADLIEYSPTAFREAFGQYSQIAAVMSAGIAVRGIAPLLADKWTDPAVVVVTPDLGLAIPLIGGHHGANALARDLAPLGTVPVITTATERAGVSSVEGIAAAGGYSLVNYDSSTPVNAAFLDGTAGVYAVSGPALVIGGPDVAFLVAEGEYGVGIGCRKGVSAEAVEEAVRAALAAAEIEPGDVLVFATTVKKSGE